MTQSRETRYDKRGAEDPRHNRSLNDRLTHPSFHPELIPVFMMIETELFRKLNEKAAVRNIGYDTMMRIILRDHIADYE